MRPQLSRRPTLSLSGTAVMNCVTIGGIVLPNKRIQPTARRARRG